MATHWTLGCDAADPQRLAAFWADALGYVREDAFADPDNASIVDPLECGLAIGFLRVPEPKTAKNRMHVDIRVAGKGPWDLAERERLIRAKVPTLVAAGEEHDDDALDHVVMLDPDGSRPLLHAGHLSVGAIRKGDPPEQLRRPGRPFPYRSGYTPVPLRYGRGIFANGGQPRNTTRVATPRDSS